MLKFLILNINIIIFNVKYYNDKLRLFKYMYVCRN